MNNPNKIKKYVAGRFKAFGVNKRQEIARLLYEISKREKEPFKKILSGELLEEPNFFDIKNYLIKRRFPSIKNAKAYLPDININPKYKVKIKKLKLNPKNIYVEESAKNSSLAAKIKSHFSKAKVIPITSFRDFVKNKKFTLDDYNKRRDNFFIVKEKYDFFKKCPCTARAVSCGYHIFNLGVGCIFECTYCFLQEYVNAPGITIPANIGDFFDFFGKYKHKIRLGTGEFADSLALDDITDFSPMLIDFFRQHPETIFEFKTKSDNIEKVISGKPAKNVVIAWSLNPQSIIDKNEFYTASLKERLEAADKCIESGFDVAFHFDPIFYYAGWQSDYENLVNRLFDKIKASRIRWISLGTFRFTRQLKKVIENRFPDNDILDAELTLGYDQKMRYNESTRLDVYKNMVKWIRKRSRKVFLYLCMEEKTLWQECGLIFPKKDVWRANK